MCLHWIRSVRGWGPWRRQWKCLLVVGGPVLGSKSRLRRCSRTQWLSEETTYLGFHAVFNAALRACPWPWKAKGKGGIGDLVVVAPIHQWNLTLCPDGTKYGLQPTGTSPSSKGHLAGISHTPPHTHIKSLICNANWFSARPSHPFVNCDMWLCHLHVSMSSYNESTFLLLH